MGKIPQEKPNISIPVSQAQFINLKKKKLEFSYLFVVHQSPTYATPVSLFHNQQHISNVDVFFKRIGFLKL